MISGGEYDSVYSTGDGAYMVVVRKADADISAAYLTSLADAGFEERIRYSDEKNIFGSFEGNGLTVYTAFCDKTLRVIVQKGSLSDIMFPLPQAARSRSFRLSVLPMTLKTTVRCTKTGFRLSGGSRTAAL